MIYDIELNSAAHYPVRGIVELSPQIEAAGFGAFWKGESNSTDPLVLLSAIAARTRTLKLGTAIYHIYGRSPVTPGHPVRDTAGLVRRDGCCSASVLPTRRSPPGTTASSTVRCAARANTSRS